MTWIARIIEEDDFIVHLYTFHLSPHYTVNLRVATKPEHHWLGHIIPPNWCADLKTDAGGQILAEQEELTPEDLSDLKTLIPTLQEEALLKAQGYLQLQKWRINQAIQVLYDNAGPVGTSETLLKVDNMTKQEQLKERLLETQKQLGMQQATVTSAKAAYLKELAKLKTLTKDLHRVTFDYVKLVKDWNDPLVSKSLDLTEKAQYTLESQRHE